MKKEYADKWIEALESGKYTQCMGKLFDGKNYCCLGVACDIFLDQEFVETDSEDTSYVVEGTREGLELPYFLMEEMGMKKSYGQLLENDNSINASLVNMNDGGRSFEEIAQAIRENWEKL